MSVTSSPSQIYESGRTRVVRCLLHPCTLLESIDDRSIGSDMLDGGSAGGRADRWSREPVRRPTARGAGRLGARIRRLPQICTSPSAIV